MSLYKYKGTGNNGVFSWVMQRVSAIILLIAVAYHVLGMITGAYNGMPTFVLGLILIFGIWHGVNGLKMITDDYVSCGKMRAILFLLYWLIGTGVFIQGFKILSTFTF